MKTCYNYPLMIHHSAAGFLRKIGVRFFGSHLEFRVRLFNILASAGVSISFVITIFNFLNNLGPVNITASVFAMLISMALVFYASKSGKYQFCYMVTIIVIFLGVFPLFFFLSGAYNGSMPGFFVFAIIFTVSMLEGKKALFMAGFELVVYITLLLVAYNFPHTVHWFSTDLEILVHVLISFIVISVSLCITMFLHFRLYNQQNRELEAARRQAEEHARIKAELFAGMSHEMRTPLTVMSSYAQYAVEQIRKDGANEQTLADLATISDEAKRLAQMADGVMKMLLSGSDTGAGLRQTAPVNIRELTERLTRLLEPAAARKGRMLTTKIDDNIPGINGDADGLTRLMWNVLHNALVHSDGDIDITAKAENGGVRVIVRDGGRGIESGILPHVFERGVSGKKGGSGFGLAICREIVTRHGGEITAENEEGRGARISFTLKDINPGKAG